MIACIGDTSEENHRFNVDPASHDAGPTLNRRFVHRRGVSAAPKYAVQTQIVVTAHLPCKQLPRSAYAAAHLECPHWRYTATPELPHIIYTSLP